MTQTFTIQGLHCESCMKLIALKIKKIDGVQNVAVHGLDGVTDVTSEREIGRDELASALLDTDYTIA